MSKTPKYVPMGKPAWAEDKPTPQPNNPEASDAWLDEIADLLLENFRLARMEAKARIQSHIDAECNRARLTERIERLQELIDYANGHPPLMADDVLLSRLYTAKGQLSQLSPTAEGESK